jgi:Cu/Ag efflux protein CusF
MLKRKIFWLGAILAIVMLVGSVGCTSAELQAYQGTLENVDSVSGDITVKLKDGATQTFNFTDVKVETIREALGNASLEIGDQVTIRAQENGDVEEVETQYAEIEGAITGLGTESDKKVTITTKKGTVITLTVTPDTMIRIEDGGTVTFTDLRVGQKVEAKYDVASENVLRISVETDEEDEAVKIEGTIKSIDTVAKTVVITTEKKGDITLTVTPETKIIIEDKGPAAFEELKSGQKVEAKYDKSNMNALTIGVDTEEEGNQDHQDDDDCDDND